jgi:hypothetical protein
MSNAKTLELRTLEDEDLLDVVGGCSNHCCRPCKPCEPCEPCKPCCGFECEIILCVPCL